MDEQVVRDVVEADGPAVRDLILAGLAEHWGTVDPTLNPDLDDLATAYGHGRTVVVVEPCGAIVATGTIVPRSGADPQRTADDGPDGGTADDGAEIVRMSVAARRRGQGLGRLVLDELLATAEAWGCNRVVLETSSHWAGAVAFYQRCGFGVTHTVEGPFGSDTWFRLDLDPAAEHHAAPDHHPQRRRT